ncbi:MAG: hypothetical protein ACR2MX_07065 [Cyclobacteriaceae bacterium]
MGVRKSVIKIRDHENDMRVYKIKGVDKTIVARKGGPSTEEVKSGENYATLRKNQKEFAAASNLASTLRHSLPKKMAKICEPYVSGKLTAQFRNLAQMSQGDVGKRPIMISTNGKSLEGFDFNPNRPLKEVFPHNIMVMNGSTYGQLIVHVPSFTPSEDLEAPEGATHYQMITHMLMLSDYTYESESKEYNPSEPEFHAKHITHENPIHPLISYPEESNTLQLSLYNGEPIPEHTGLFLIMGIKFYQYKKQRYFDLAENSAMQIIKAY